MWNFESHEELNKHPRQKVLYIYIYVYIYIYGGKKTWFLCLFHVLILIKNKRVETRSSSHLILFHPRPATFYTIPKIHKLPKLVVSTCPNSNPKNFIIEAQRLNINPPGRPIVWGVVTLTEYVSAFVDWELQPLLANIPSYIEDTTDYLNKLSRFNNLPDNTI